MKTNQVMIREQKGFEQRTKDGYFNANSLLSVWNETHSKNQTMRNYTQNDAYVEYLVQLKKEGINNPIITARGRLGGSWMHPKLFIDFAMWLSVEFKSIVVDYVLDGLIKTRRDAGDYYNEMCVAIMERYISFYNRKPPPFIFIQEANLVKSLALNVDKPRNELSEQELRQITYLQKVNANLISKGIGRVSRIKRLREANEIQI